VIDGLRAVTLDGGVEVVSLDPYGIQKEIVLARRLYAFTRSKSRR